MIYLISTITILAVVFLTGLFICLFIDLVLGIKPKQMAYEISTALSDSFVCVFPGHDDATYRDKDSLETPPLSREERTCREILSKLQGDSIWHEAISAALASGTDQDFRDLISQLKSEALPVPHIMKNILGAEAFERVMTL
jgi:hypothetical protein